MRFDNTRGRLIGGIGGGPAFVDDVYITGRCCGYWGWLNGQPAGQDCAEAGCHLIAADGTELEAEADRKGANYFQAAGPYWAASLGVKGDPIPKSRSNFGPIADDMVPVAADPANKDIVFVQSFSQGMGLVVHNGATVVATVATGPLDFVTDRTSIKNRLLSYFERGFGPRVLDLNTMQYVQMVDRLADWRIALRATSGVILVERADGLLRVRRADTLEGVTIQTLAYYFDAMLLDPNTLQMAWTPTPGEVPGGLRQQRFVVSDLPTGVVTPPPQPGYNPKPDLTNLRVQMAASVTELDRIIGLLP